MFKRKYGVKTCMGVMIGLDEKAPFSVRKEVIKNMARYSAHERKFTLFHKTMRFATWYLDTAAFDALSRWHSAAHDFLDLWFGKLIGGLLGYSTGLAIGIIPLIIQAPIFPYFILKAYSQRKMVFKAYKDHRNDDI